MKIQFLLILGIVIFIVVGFFMHKKINRNPNYEIGQPIDSLHGVAVYYNGGVSHVKGRALAEDGYNLGLKYQCVEFVKRYYYEALNHKMPNTYGHAKDFFNAQISDGKINKQRNLRQFKNPSTSKPKINDLVIYSATRLNKYGHVAIISNVTENKIEIIQQNPGPFRSTREIYELKKINGKWYIGNDQILGWLRK